MDQWRGSPVARGVVGKKRQYPVRISHQDLLFEDVNYVAIAKRSGWLVHATVDKNRPNVFDALRAFLKHRDGRVSSQLALHHRLDLDTSGVLLFAKTKAASQVLAKQFESREITKEYLALCIRKPAPTVGRLTHFLAQRKGARTVSSVQSGGKKAITDYEFIKEEQGISWVRFRPVTGRRHQLRVQSSIANFPILGDPLYGTAIDDSGQRLHAERLAFEDPLSGQNIEIRCPLPKKFDLQTTQTSSSTQTILFHKPFGVLSQFTSPAPDTPTLAAFNLPANIYPVGRLDKDSEGLLLLSNAPKLQQRIANPTAKQWKTYWAQVEGIPQSTSLALLEKGILLKGKKTLPCRVKSITPPLVEPRVPPIRHRKSVPTSWVEIQLQEGRNRQVRKMLAYAGAPVLRLIRVSIGPYHLETLPPGKWKQVPPRENLTC